jgi:hypothetical protein
MEKISYFIGPSIFATDNFFGMLEEVDNNDNKIYGDEKMNEKEYSLGMQVATPPRPHDQGETRQAYSVIEEELMLLKKKYSTLTDHLQNTQHRLNKAESRAEAAEELMNKLLDKVMHK